MYFSHTLLSSLLALLASSSLASAVCTGDEFAIGTPSANAATGLTTCKTANLFRLLLPYSPPPPPNIASSNTDRRHHLHRRHLRRFTNSFCEHRQPYGL